MEDKPRSGREALREMERGMWTIGETQAEAEEAVRRENPNIKILRSKEIDLSGLPPLRRPLPKHWVVVFEDPDPSKFPQDEDPEGKVEQEVREMYRKMATDLQSLVRGYVEEFNCPACDKRIHIEMPKPESGQEREETNCPECGERLGRNVSDRTLRVLPAPAA